MRRPTENRRVSAIVPMPWASRTRSIFPCPIQLADTPPRIPVIRRSSVGGTRDRGPNSHPIRTLQAYHPEVRNGRETDARDRRVLSGDASQAMHWVSRHFLLPIRDRQMADIALVTSLHRRVALTGLMAELMVVRKTTRYTNKINVVWRREGPTNYCAAGI